MTAPAVSVCIPVYNGLPYLESTLESVVAQSFADFEVVIRDDCSTDGTFEWLQARYGADSRFRLHRNATNLDVGPQYDALFREARGRYVLKLDSDDLIEPLLLERLTGIAEQSGADFVGADFDWYRAATGERLRPNAREHFPEGADPDPAANVLLNNPYHLCFAIWRRAMLDRVEREGQYVLFTETCDWEFQLRLALAGARFQGTREVLGLYRLHDSNRSSAPNAQLRSVVLDVLPYWGASAASCIGRSRLQRFVRKLATDYVRAVGRNPRQFDFEILAGFARLFAGRPRFPRWCLDRTHMARMRARRNVEVS